MQRRLHGVDVVRRGGSADGVLAHDEPAQRRVADQEAGVHRDAPVDPGMSVLVSEYPVRENIPTPDPLGEVPFDADPIFARLKDLRGPFLSEVTEPPEDYLERVEAASGIADVDGAAVPLLLGDITWGVLGFLHFGRHQWTPAEINALQAVASMLVQLQARSDAEACTEYIAHHDDLTGLPNRRALLQELEDRLAAHRALIRVPLLRPRSVQGHERLG